MSADNIKFGLRENQTVFRPGDEIAGAAHWELQTAPKSVEVRLCWFTRGKGTEDAKVVETIPFDDPKAGDMRFCFFRAPREPYSFSGKLISLIWCVEFVVEPGKHFQRLEITIGPEAREVVII